MLTAIISGTTSVALAQEKIDKYCEVTVKPRNELTSKKKVKISFGENKPLFSLKDTTLYQKLNYVKSLTNEADVLNYMAGLGWTVINIHAGYPGDHTEVLYFKKTFDTTELTADTKAFPSNN